MEYKSIAEALHQYLLTCPLLGDCLLYTSNIRDEMVEV